MWTSLLIVIRGVRCSYEVWVGIQLVLKILIISLPYDFLTLFLIFLKKCFWSIVDFTMLCLFQVYNKVIQLYVYSFCFRPSPHISYYRILSGVPCAIPRSFLVIYFIYSSVCMLIPSSWSPRFPFLNHVCFWYICLFLFCKFMCIIFKNCILHMIFIFLCLT